MLCVGCLIGLKGKNNKESYMSNLAEEMQDSNGEKKRGNPALFKGMPSLNPAGRPKKVLEKEKRTNRALRSEEFLNLVRKFRPHLTKAIQAAVKILDNEKANDQNKLRASALIISTYKDLVKELYDFKYDNEEAEEIQEKNAPVFSLKIINNDKEE